MIRYTPKEYQYCVIFSFLKFMQSLPRVLSKAGLTMDYMSAIIGMTHKLAIPKLRELQRKKPQLYNEFRRFIETYLGIFPMW